MKLKVQSNGNKYVVSTTISDNELDAYVDVEEGNIFLDTLDVSGDELPLQEVIKFLQSIKKELKPQVIESLD